MEIRSVALPSGLPATHATGTRAIRNRKNEPSLDHECRHSGGQPGRGIQRNVGPRTLSFHGYRSVRHSLHGPRRKLGLLASSTHSADSRLHHGSHHRPARSKSERFISSAGDDCSSSRLPNVGQYR